MPASPKTERQADRQTVESPKDNKVQLIMGSDWELGPAAGIYVPG